MLEVLQVETVGSKERGRFLKLRDGVEFWGGFLCWSKIPALLTGITPSRGLDNARLVNFKCVALGTMAWMSSAYLQNTTWEWIVS